MKHLFEYYNELFPLMWDKPALTDYGTDHSYTFGELAEQIERLGCLFDLLGVTKGDHIALCGRNCANWAVAYLAIAVHDNVIISILQDFASDDIMNLVNHSDAKILMVGPHVWRDLPHDPNIIVKTMPNIKAIVLITDFSVLYQRTGERTVNSIADTEEMFMMKYRTGFSSADVHYRTDNLDDMMLINYTSGSTGNPKGVMLSYRNISANIASGHLCLPNKPGWRIVSMLPLAHMYGQLAEFLFPLSGGCHIFFLAKTPTPSLLLDAFSKVKPFMIVTVPLIIEKICRNSVFPITNTRVMRFLWHMPAGIGRFVRRTVKSKILRAFGGRLRYFIVGGAAINPEVEQLLLKIHFPLCVGYGMTECGPLIGGCKVDEFIIRSAGRILPGNDIRIDSDDPYNNIGEILVKGDHVMMGYYKNPEETRRTLTEDRWLKTGDLGIIDANKNIFVKGRCKTMILGASGQNIYPEEIEDKLNNMEGVMESIIVEREGKLMALVFPDAKGEITFRKPISELMKENLKRLNKLLPKYSQIFQIELRDKEFEKTPKRSIKRFLYK